MYSFVRWVLFAGVLYWSLTSANPWLYGLAFFIAFWPTPDERVAFFNRQSVQDRAIRRYNKVMSEQG